MEMIPFLIESKMGHEEKLVPEDKLVEEVNKQVEDGKWVTLENKDGTADMITKPIETKPAEQQKIAGKVNLDALDDDEEESAKSDTSASTPEKSDWKGTFGGVKSATATNKLRGG